MEFIVITVAIMTISSLMLHRMLKLCGLNINLQPLILCGILALLVNFSAITISPYLSTAHFIMLGVLVFVSSAAATWYNHWLDIKVNIPVAITAETAEPVVPEFAETAESLTEPPTPEETPHEIDTDDIDTAPESPVSEVVPAAKDTAERVQEEDSMEEIIVESAPAEVPTVEDTHETVPSENPVYEIIEKLVPAEATTDNTSTIEPDTAEAITDDVIIDEADTDEAPVDDIIDETDVDEAPTDVIIDESDTDETPVDVVIDESDTDEAPVDDIIDETDVDVAPVDVITDETDVDVAPVKEEYVPVIEDSVVAAVAAMETLDDILDYAFEQKTLSNFQNSLYASAEALRQYRDDSYAPFIAIDMINICKTIGDYGRAVEIYHDAINLPAVVENPDIKHELQAGLVYITCIIKILANHEISNTPYSNIPSDVMKEIEKIYIIHKNNI